jgi:sec-independent protein translocase protein TatC
VSAEPAPKGSGHMTIWEHLAELRSRLIKVAMAVGVGTVVGWFVYPYLLDFLLEPFRAIQGPDAQVITTEPLQAFTLRLQMSVYLGIAMAMPVILWQLWRFITPALYPHEKKYAIPFTVSAMVLFVGGAWVAYLILVPTLQFLISVGGENVEPLYTAPSYISLIVWMMLAFGLGFEFPVVVVALQLIGVLTPRQLLGWWRFAMVIIAIVAAVITPSADPISMLALAVPMALLYFASIGVGALVLGMRRRRAAKAGTAG